MSNETITPKVTKTVVNAEGKRVKRPVQKSERKRPSKSFIEKSAEIRGFMSGNEKTQLATLKLKNVWQRINNRAMSDNVNDTFTGAENDEIQKLIREFVKGIDAVLQGK